MPIIHIEISAGRTHEEKTKIAKAVTDAVAESAKLDPAKVMIFFVDVPRHNQAVGGVLRAAPS